MYTCIYIYIHVYIHILFQHEAAITACSRAFPSFQYLPWHYPTHPPGTKDAAPIFACLLCASAKTPVVVRALWVEPRHLVNAGWVCLLGWIIRIETGIVYPLPSMFLVPPTKTKKQCWTHLPSWKALNKPFVATTMNAERSNLAPGKGRRLLGSTWQRSNTKAFQEPCKSWESSCPPTVNWGW